MGPCILKLGIKRCMQPVAKREFIHGSENSLIRPQMSRCQSIGPFTEHLLSRSDSL